MCTKGLSETRMWIRVNELNCVWTLNKVHYSSTSQTDSLSVDIVELKLPTYSEDVGQK